MNVFVTNYGDTPLTIGWDGVLYNFEKNLTVEIPEGAARQLFGFGCEDKEFVLVRHGWIKLHSELEEGLKILEQFVITNEPPVQNSSLPSAVGAIPLRINKSAGGKSSIKRVA
jgi:hypothetical protein